MRGSTDRRPPSGQGQGRSGLPARLRRDRRGTAAIEFAMLLPFLILLFGAVLETSLAIWRWHTVRLLADEATRVASVQSTLSASEVEQLAIGRVAGLDRDRLSLTIDMAATGTDGGPAIAVVASYDHRFMVPDLLNVGGGIRLSAETLMPVVD